LPCLIEFIVVNSDELDIIKKASHDLTKHQVQKEVFFYMFFIRFKFLHFVGFERTVLSNFFFKYESRKTSAQYWVHFQILLSYAAVLSFSFTWFL